MTIRRIRGGLAATAASLLLAVALAACGSSTPTPVPTATPTVTPTAIPTPTPSPTPDISIVPVPTSQLAAPSSPAVHLDQPTAAALQAALDGLRRANTYPGVAAAVAFPDGTVWAGVAGSAILKPATPVTTDTLFSVASISKTFVAALIGRLSMTGTIGLDDLLSKYVPDFPGADVITIRKLLNHTSCIDDVFDPAGSIGPAVLAHPAATWTADEVFARLLKLPYAAGACYNYSNTDYILLGMVAEKATGQTVAALVRSMFLVPLGLGHTFLQTEEAASGPEAHGYMPPASNPRDNSAGTMLPFTAEATAVGVAGAYVSTASDLAVWASALYGGAVLDNATLASMVDISPTLQYKLKWPYGLGLEETTVAGQVAWGHRGHLDGFWSAMEYLPAYHLSIVVLTNAEWADPVAAASALAKVALG